MTHNEDSPLTRSERDRFDALPRTADPDPLLENRVVQALRVEGAFARRRWYRRAIPVPLAAAAGFLLFAVGAVAGARLAPWLADESASAPDQPVRTISAPVEGRLVGWL
jgi:hypothetical protein